MKQIGIIMSKVYKTMNREQLRGMLSVLFENGFHGLVFTISEEFFDNRVKQGEINLLNAINFNRLSGIIYLPFSFSDMEIMQEIERTLSTQCKKPIVCVGTDDRFGEHRPYDARVWFDDTMHFERLTSHLINAHSCQKILCLTGPKHMKTSHRRANGFRLAMKAANLPITDASVIFGDYWVDAATALGARILSGELPKPDAVVCGNDTMATALCDVLKAGGISVPEQIRITGYDSTPEANAHIPSLTSFSPDMKRLGAVAAERLLALLHHRKPDKSELSDGKMIYGESCGHPRRDFRTVGYDYERMESGYVDTTLPTRLLCGDSFSVLIRNIYETTYTFTESNYKSATAYRLCLCTDWDSSEFSDGSERYRTKGYTEQMIVTNMKNNEELFSSSLMIPPDMRRDSPSVYFFSAAHFRDHCFGWSIFRLDGFADGYDVFYTRFCREVNHALAFLSLQINYKSLAYCSFVAGTRDTLTGLYLFERCPHIWDETASLASLYGEQIYILLLEMCGLKKLEETDSRLIREQCASELADIIQHIHSSKEKIFRISDTVFAVIGSEPSPAKRPEQLSAAANEQFRSKWRSGTTLRSCTVLLTDMERHSFSAASTEIAAAVAAMRKSTEPSNPPNPHRQMLDELRREIYSEPEQTWNTDKCCQRMNMSRSYLQKIYFQAFEVTCARDILNAKLHHAKKLLLHTNLTLQDIAVRCGYDYSHFMRMFKKETGLTPTEFRIGT